MEPYKTALMRDEVSAIILGYGFHLDQKKQRWMSLDECVAIVNRARETEPQQVRYALEKMVKNDILKKRRVTSPKRKSSFMEYSVIDFRQVYASKQVLSWLGRHNIPYSSFRPQKVSHQSLDTEIDLLLKLSEEPMTYTQMLEFANNGRQTQKAKFFRLISRLTEGGIVAKPRHTQRDGNKYSFVVAENFFLCQLPHVVQDLIVKWDELKIEGVKRKTLIEAGQPQSTRYRYIRKMEDDGLIKVEEQRIKIADSYSNIHINDFIYECVRRYSHGNNKYISEISRLWKEGFFEKHPQFGIKELAPHFKNRSSAWRFMYSNQCCHLHKVVDSVDKKHKTYGLTAAGIEFIEDVMGSVRCLYSISDINLKPIGVEPDGARILDSIVKDTQEFVLIARGKLMRKSPFLGMSKESYAAMKLFYSEKCCDWSLLQDLNGHTVNGYGLPKKLGDKEIVMNVRHELRCLGLVDGFDNITPKASAFSDYFTENGKIW